MLNQVEGSFDGDRYIVASEIVEHDTSFRKTDWKYNYDAPPLYVCVCDANLDELARLALQAVAASVNAAWWSAENYLLARSRAQEDIVLVKLDTQCSCGRPHRATFYGSADLGVEGSAPLSERCLLADMCGAVLEERLDGIASKSEIMDLLEKLIIRWQLVAERILVAAPFMGHQWMSPEERKSIWEWLGRNLDPSKAIVVTRSATWRSIKKLVEMGEVGHDELSRFGLEDKIVSGGVKKQDFHAKFFAGLSADGVEVLSGSANLLRGSSFENISFRGLSRSAFEQRYLSKLGLLIPTDTVTSKGYVVIAERGGSWSAGEGSGHPFTL